MSSVRIAEALRARIASGELKVGARVPSARQIMRKWGVANATAAKALSILADEGLVRARPGVGTVVTSRAAAEEGLSEALVVQIGLRIADREGLAAVSMRRIATELGSATMSLYRYVPNKEELVLKIADAAFAGLPLAKFSSRARLRDKLEACARAQWAVYLKHPWLANAISLSRPQLMPNAMHYTEQVLQVLASLPLSTPQRLLTALSIAGYVRGAAVSLEMEAQARQDTGLDPRAYMEKQEAAFAALTASGAYPHIVALNDAPDIDFGPQRVFEFGLAALLDGLSARLGP